MEETKEPKPKTDFERGLDTGRKEVLTKLKSLLHSYGRSNLIRKSELNGLIDNYEE